MGVVVVIVDDARPKGVEWFECADQYGLLGCGGRSALRPELLLGDAGSKYPVCNLHFAILHLSCIRPMNDEADGSGGHGIWMGRKVLSGGGGGGRWELLLLLLVELVLCEFELGEDGLLLLLLLLVCARGLLGKLSKLNGVMT